MESPALVDSPIQVFPRHLNIEFFESGVPAYFVSYAPTIYMYCLSINMHAKFLSEKYTKCILLLFRNKTQPILTISNQIATCTHDIKLFLCHNLALQTRVAFVRIVKLLLDDAQARAMRDEDQ